MKEKPQPEKTEIIPDIVLGEKKIDEVPIGISTSKEFDKEAWQPKTSLGRKVKAGEISDINEILDKGIRILEPEITECLIPNLETEIITTGQSKGKFGGGKGSIWRQTQKKTAEGNRASFTLLTAIGNHDGYIGIGHGRAKETVPARAKSLRQAKLNIIKIRRGCGSWECECASHHSIPFAVQGRCGSSRIILMPAPKGTGLCVEKECKKILLLAGIKDVYSKTFGQTRTKLNLAYACFEALKQLTKIKVQDSYHKIAGIVEGRV